MTWWCRTSTLVMFATLGQNQAFQQQQRRRIVVSHRARHLWASPLYQLLEKLPRPSPIATALGGGLIGPSIRASTSSLVQTFVDGYNNKAGRSSLSSLAACCDDNVILDDATYWQPACGVNSVMRRLQMQHQAYPGRTLVVDDLVVASGDCGGNAMLQFHVSNDNDSDVASKRGVAVFDIHQDKIASITWFVEPQQKRGAASLQLLRTVSNIVSNKNVNTTPSPPPTSSLSLPERYFAAWSRRDVDAAMDLFADDCTYDDTAFPDPFRGKEALQSHLQFCADALPDTFRFDVDGVLQDGNKMVAKWHVSNNGQALPFTRGCSVYTSRNRDSGRIQDGIDFVEASPPKPGGLDLWTNIVPRQLSLEPVRWIPLYTWIAYIYFVFFSDGILPGASALALESRTWEEVWKLSLNFFLVAPLLQLDFSPTVHPVLEGVFNLLLSWAALFAGFLSDDRRDKANLLPMLPMVAGMQLLTSAFLLPYLVTRSTEHRTTNVQTSELSKVAQVCESKLLGPAMASVGMLSIVWACIGRTAEYGSDLGQRYASFVDLLRIDRVGSSFLVDLVLFGLFQGWLIDNDLQRRGVVVARDEARTLRQIGKYVPFFGLAAYLTLRPSLSDDATGQR